MRKLLQWMLRSAGLHVSRLPSNRFDAMLEVLQRLARERFRPTVIIDCGANRGQWATIVSAVFPDVPLHLIEPQTACRPALDAFAARRGAAEVHTMVVSRPGAHTVRMIDGNSGSTGAHITHDPARTDGALVPATTIDTLLSDRLRDTDRVLLKLDVEGHELDVLAGARAVLSRVDVIISEVDFYDVEHTGHPTFVQYSTVLSEYGFAFYDFATLASRKRDGRLRLGDALFVRRGSSLLADNRWA